MKSTNTGIFLHRLNYSDTSLITTFYTREKGIRKFIFKGGKKKAHVLFPLSICELSFYGRQDSELLHLTSADPAVPLSFQFDPVKSTIAFFVAEIIRKSCELEDQDETMYDFIQEAVEKLDKSDDCQMIPLELLIDLTKKLGVQPFATCAEPTHFDLDEGQLQASAGKSIRTVSGLGVELIANHLKGTPSARYNRTAREEALQIMLDYFRIHIPGFNQIDSYEIVREVLHG